MMTVWVAAAAEDDPAAMRWTRMGKFQDLAGRGFEVEIRSLAVDPQNPDTVWAGLQHHSILYGIFQSDSPDKVWKCAYQGMHYHDWVIVFSLAQPSVVYAATTGGGGIIRSEDGGKSWAGIGDIGSVQALAPHPTDPLVLYAALYGSGVTHTRTAGDGGWESLLKELYMTCIAIDHGRPSTIFAGAVSVSDSDPRGRYGLFRTTNGGTTWDAVLDDKKVWAVAVDPANSSVVLCGTGANGLFRSVDGGVTWTGAVMGLSHPSISAIAFSPANSQVVYVGTRGEGVFRSEDGGASWKPMNDALGDMWITALAVHPQDTDRLYAGTRSGVFSWGRPVPVVMKPDETPSAPAIAADEPIAVAALETEPTLRGYRQGLLVLAAAAVGLVFLLWKATRRKTLPTAGDASGVPPAAMSTVSSASSGAILVDSDPRWAEAMRRTQQAAMAGYVFSGIYALVFIFEAAGGSTRFGVFLGVFCLVEAVLFFSGSLLAKARRPSWARVIWLIAGYAGIPLGLIMVGFANRMNTALKSVERGSGDPPPGSVQPSATAGAGAVAWAVEVRSEEDPLKRACKQEIMRFLTSARTRQHEQQSGARWSRNDLLLVVTKAGLDQGKSREAFFVAANAAVDELARERSIVGTDSGYRAN